MEEDKVKAKPIRLEWIPRISDVSEKARRERRGKGQRWDQSDHGFTGPRDDRMAGYQDCRVSGCQSDWSVCQGQTRWGSGYVEVDSRGM
jgi:hypothetical protein